MLVVLYLKITDVESVTSPSVVVAGATGVRVPVGPITVAGVIGSLQLKAK